jgi:hypothetical protein
MACATFGGSRTAALIWTCAATVASGDPAECLRRNLPRRLPLAFVSLTVGSHPQGLQACRVEKTRRMQIIVQRMCTWLPRAAAPHIAGPIHFSAQLFQHIRGLSPTSQFSPSGGAGGNAPTPGAEIPTRPSKYNVRRGRRSHWRPLRRCREVTWLVRAIAGVASMAAAISAADRSLT